MIRLTLPPPPSTNALFANVPGKGRVRTAAYKRWATAAGWEAKLQAKGETIAGKFRLSIWTPTRVDLDNSVKAIADLLGPQTEKRKHSIGITDDDRYMVELHAYRSVGPNCVVEIHSAE